MSGAPWSWENWNDGEPNQNGNEDCGAFDSQGGYKVIKLWKPSPQATEKYLNCVVLLPELLTERKPCGSKRGLDHRIL